MFNNIRIKCVYFDSIVSLLGRLSAARYSFSEAWENNVIFVIKNQKRFVINAGNADL